MSTFTKNKLSGSTNGKPQKVTGTATGSSILVHTAVSGTSSFDEVWIWATNTSSSDVVLTLEWGDNTTPDGNIIVTVPKQSGLYLITPGLVLQNSLTVRAFAGTGNVINLVGFVNTIS